MGNKLNKEPKSNDLLNSEGKRSPNRDKEDEDEPKSYKQAVRPNSDGSGTEAIMVIPGASESTTSEEDVSRESMEVEEPKDSEETPGNQRLIEFFEKIKIVQFLPKEDYDGNLTRIFIGEEPEDDDFIDDPEEYELGFISQLLNKMENTDFKSQFEIILPYVFDLIKRRRSFDQLLQAMIDTQLDFFKDLTTQDLLALIIERLSPHTQAKIGYLLVKGNYPIPFAYKIGPSPSNWKVNFKLFYDLMVENDKVLMTMVGTGNQCGISALNSKLFGLKKNRKISSLDGFTHTGSINVYMDIKLKQNKLVLADIHSYLDDPQFKKVCKMLFNFSAIVVVHVTRDDFESNGDHKKPLAGLLESLYKDVVLEKRGHVLVLWRDFRNEFEQVQKLNDYMQNTFGTRYAGLKNVKNLTALNDKQHKSELKSIQEYFADLLRKNYSTPDYHLHFLTHLETFFNEDCDKLLNASEFIAQKYTDQQSHLIQHYYDLLDSAAKENPNLLCALFPYLYNKYVKWERTEQLEALKVQMDKEPQNFKTLDEKRCGLEKDLEKIDKEDTNRSVSGFVKELFTTLKRRDQTLNIKAFENAILLWKLPKVKPKLEEWSELSNRLLQGPMQMSDDEKNRLKTQIGTLEYQLENLDISLDSGISEIMCAYEARKRLGQDSSTIEKPLRDYFKVVMDSGSPINLIDGKTLLYGNSFLEELFQGLPCNKNEQYYVISIIGSQSSAKSTLFNYLFGCGFATAAGRCTKGLYLTLIKLEDNKNIIVIDTEGLLSVCARDNLFDNKIVAMVFTIAHVVIINNKGELTATLRNLLEVCLYALKAMDKKRFKTKLLFAIRDHTDGNRETQKAMLQRLLTEINEAASKHAIDFREFLEIGDNDIYLLPSAIDKPKMFSTKVFQLRRDICGQMQRGANPYHSMQDFYTFGQSVWSAIERCGANLLNYKSMLEIQIQDNLDKLRIQIVSQYRHELLEAGQELTMSLIKQKNVKGYDFEDQIGLKFNSIVQTAKTQFGIEADKSRQYGENQQLKEKNKELIEGNLAFAKGCLCKDWESEYNAKLKEDEQAEVLKNINKEFSQVLRKGGYSHEEHMKTLKIRKAITIETQQKKLEEELKDPKLKFDLARKVQNAYYGLKEKKSIQNSLYKTFPDFHCNDIVKLESGKLRSYKLARYISGLGYIDRGVNLFKNKDQVQRALDEHIQDFYTMLEQEVSDEAKDFVEHTIEQCFVFFDRMIISLQIKIDKDILARDFFAEGLAIIYTETIEREKQIRKKKMQASIETTQKEFEDFEKLLVASQDSFKSGTEIAHQVFDLLFYNFAKKKFHEVKLSLAQKINSSLPGPEEANKLAYAESFGSRNFRNVYKYVRNINKFIKEIYDGQTADFSKVLIDKQLDNSEAAFIELINKLKLLVEQWELGLEDMEKQKDPATIWSSLANIVSSSEELKSYLNFDILASKPANFDQHNQFAEGFRNGISHKLKECNLKQQLSQKLSTDIDNFLKERWNDICGCQAVCPMCGNKCKLPNDNHTQHQANFHFFPSFKNIFFKDTNKLVLTHCLSKESIVTNWFWKGNTLSSFDEVIATDAPDWRDEFPRVDQPERFVSEIPTNVKLCWVGVKELLKLKFPHMVDNTPQEWLGMLDQDKVLRTLDEDLQRYN